MKNNIIKILFYSLVSICLYANSAIADKVITLKPLDPGDIFYITNAKYAGDGWNITNLNVQGMIVTNVQLQGNMYESTSNWLTTSGNRFDIYIKTNYASSGGFTNEVDPIWSSVSNLYLRTSVASNLFLSLSYTNTVNNMFNGLNTNLWDTVTNKANISDLTNYASLTYVNNLGTNYLNKSWSNNIISLEGKTNYWNAKADTSWVLTALSGYYPASNPSNYVNSNIITGLATTNFVTNALSSYYPRNNPSNFISTNFVINYAYPISNPSNYVNSNIITGLATTNFVTNALSSYYPVSNPSNYVNTNIITGLASTQWVVGQGYLKTETDPVWSIEKTQYATTTYVNNATSLLYPRSNPSNYITTNNLTGFATTNYVQQYAYPVGNPSNYTTLNTVTNWVKSQGYITNAIFTETDPYFNAVSNRIPYLETNGNLNMKGHCITNACFNGSFTGDGSGLYNLDPNNSPYTNQYVPSIQNVKQALDFLMSNSITMNGLQLKAQFTAIPTLGNPPLAVTFTDSSLANITNRLWDFNGDGIFDATNPPYPTFTNTYLTTNTYNATLVVQTYGGYSSTTSILVKVADNMKYWGVVNSGTVNDSDIWSLYSETATNRFMYKTIAAGQTGYIYFAWPDIYGTGSVWVQPFNIQLNSWTNWYQTHIQQNGLTNVVRIWRSDVGGDIINASTYEIK